MEAIGFVQHFFHTICHPYIFYRPLNLKATIKQTLNKSNGDGGNTVARIALKFIRFNAHSKQRNACQQLKRKLRATSSFFFFSNNHHVIRKLITFDAHPNCIIITFTLEIPYFSFSLLSMKKRRLR